MSVHYKSKFVV